MGHYPSPFLYINAGAFYCLHQCSLGKPAKQVTSTKVVGSGKKTVSSEQKVVFVAPLAVKEKKKSVFVPFPVVKKT